MITADVRFLRAKAGRIKKRIAAHFSSNMSVTLLPGVSRVGGGAFPEQDIQTTLVGIKNTLCTADELKTVLLATDPPLVGRIENDYFCLDPRTINDKEIPLVVDVLEQAINGLG
jgi:L-seryl-tRNA(Ser) seleniumtransferase